MKLLRMYDRLKCALFGHSTPPSWAEQEETVYTYRCWCCGKRIWFKVGW